MLRHTLLNFCVVVCAIFLVLFFIFYFLFFLYFFTLLVVVVVQIKGTGQWSFIDPANKDVVGCVEMKIQMSQ